MNKKITEMLNQIEVAQKPYGKTVFRAAAQENRDGFTKWCADHACASAQVADFIEFSVKVDGLNFNGLFVYSLNPNETHNIYESNEEWWESEDLKQYLFFADDDVSWYCVDRAMSLYWVLDKPSGEQIESFDTLDGLLAKALETSLL